jgi:hypothetical protein
VITKRWLHLCDIIKVETMGNRSFFQLPIRHTFRSDKSGSCLSCSSLHKQETEMQGFYLIRLNFNLEFDFKDF